MITGITNTNGFAKNIEQNKIYQNDVLKLISKINLNDKSIINNVSGKYFDFLREDSALKEKSLNTISDVVKSYSDSLSDVKTGYIAQDQNISNS